MDVGQDDQARRPEHGGHIVAARLMRACRPGRQMPQFRDGPVKLQQPLIFERIFLWPLKTRNTIPDHANLTPVDQLFVNPAWNLAKDCFFRRNPSYTGPEPARLLVREEMSGFVFFSLSESGEL
jgi:hypothetical protein